jgi:hypothetical protein
MIRTINGNAPTTRVAACFSFGPGGVGGQVRDPDPSSTGLELEFDDLLAMRKTYAFFMEPEFRNSAEELEPGFRCVDIGYGVVYGIDAELLPKFDDATHMPHENRTAEPILGLLNSRREVYAERRSEELSVGHDGILLKGVTAPLSRTVRVRRRLG